MPASSKKLGKLTMNALQLEELLHKCTNEEEKKMDYNKLVRGENKVNRFVRKKEEALKEDSLDKIEKEIISNDVTKMIMKIKEKKEQEIREKNKISYAKKRSTQRIKDFDVVTEKRRQQSNPIKGKIDELMCEFDSTKKVITKRRLMSA